MTFSSLKGRRILVTGYDLEQGEHRGIAVFSKALIRCLNQAGAEVWLLTGFSPVTSKRFQKLPKQTRRLIQMATLLDSLVEGRQTSEVSFLERRFTWVRRFRSWQRRFSLLIELINRPKAYKANNVLSLRLQGLKDNPYLRVERLSYMHDLEGIVSAPGIFFASQSAAMLSTQKPVTVDLHGFDALLTTCPLNILPSGVPVFAQSVHDLIPLEYFAHNENQLMFSHRLQACLPARRLYVSNATAQKFHERILEPEQSPDQPPRRRIEHGECVVMQPPSLQFPDWLISDSKNVGDLEPATYLLRSDATKKPPKDADSKTLQTWVEQPILSRTKRLQPFRYLLFNSSVEARKNLFLLAEAYAESNLSSQGIHLCVTGKLKGDDYSKAVQEIVRQEPGILLTGYVNESTKLDLYLNALALLSPSLVEGFGIPVLDAACLGMPALVSDSASHLEIAALHDFNEVVMPLSTLKSRDWADGMRAYSGLGRTLWQPKLAPAERQRRIARYVNYQKIFYANLGDNLNALLAT